MLVKKNNDLSRHKDFFNQLPPEAQGIHVALMDLEAKMDGFLISVDQQAAQMRLKSGVLLNKLKGIINKGKRKGYFQTVVGLLFRDATGKQILKKTARCERMKVACLQDADKYLHLGWKKLVAISVVANDQHKTTGSFLKTIGFDPANHEALSGDEFDLELKTAKVYHQMKNNKVKPVKEALVKNAVRRNIQLHVRCVRVGLVFFLRLASHPKNLRMRHDGGVPQQPAPGPDSLSHEPH